MADQYGPVRHSHGYCPLEFRREVGKIRDVRIAQQAQARARRWKSVRRALIFLALLVLSAAALQAYAIPVYGNDGGGDSGRISDVPHEEKFPRDRLWLILYLNDEMVLVAGPLPHGEQRCNAIKMEFMFDMVKQMPPEDLEAWSTLTAKCEWHAESPVLKDPRVLHPDGSITR